MRRFSCLHEVATALGTQRVKTDGYQFKAIGVKFVAQCLPHGQVGRTASVGCPGVDQNLLAKQTAQGKFVAGKIRQRQVGCFGRGQRV